MVVVELTLALSAGVLTAFSPCGVPFLPNIVSLFLLRNPRRLHGGLGTAAFGLGILALLLPLAALGISASAFLTPYIGQFVLVSGIATLVIAIGYWRGRSLPIRGLRLDPASSGYGALFAMGAAYIVAAIGCTPALFLGVTAAAVATGSVAGSTVVLLAFVASAVAPILLLALFAAEYGETYRETILRLLRPIQRASVFLMFGLGVYLILFFILYTFFGLPV